MPISKNKFDVKIWAKFGNVFMDSVTQYAPDSGAGVSGALRISTGTYQIAFSSPMPDTNYVISAIVEGSGQYCYVVGGRSVNGFTLITANGGVPANAFAFEFTVSK